MILAEVPERGFICSVPFGPLGRKKFRDCFTLEEELPCCQSFHNQYLFSFGGSKCPVPPLTPTSFPRPLLQFPTQVFIPLLGLRSPHLLCHCVSISPKSLSPCCSILQTHSSRMKPRENPPTPRVHPKYGLFETWGSCLGADCGRCAARWCYKTAQLSTVLRGKAAVLNAQLYFIKPRGKSESSQYESLSQRL